MKDKNTFLRDGEMQENHVVVCTRSRPHLLYVFGFFKVER